MASQAVRVLAAAELVLATTGEPAAAAAGLAGRQQA
jgi:hypothetical protein